jgi:cell division protein FtsB
MAAVANAPLDFIYTLFRGDPAALKYRRLTKREADYERVLEENANLKMELEKKTKYIQELQSQLKEFERKQLMQSNTTTTKTTSAPARKRTKHC